jgi:hypothetical protein
MTNASRDLSEQLIYILDFGRSPQPMFGKIELAGWFEIAGLP